MKTEDLLLYGALGFGAYYLLIKPKQAATPLLPVATQNYLNTGQPVTPITATPVNNVANLASNLSSIYTKLFGNNNGSPSGSYIDPGTSTADAIDNIDNTDPYIVDPGFFSKPQALNTNIFSSYQQDNSASLAGNFEDNSFNVFDPSDENDALAGLKREAIYNSY